jgi:hypothetical protein
MVASSVCCPLLFLGFFEVRGLLCSRQIKNIRENSGWRGTTAGPPAVREVHNAHTLWCRNEGQDGLMCCGALDC